MVTQCARAVGASISAPSYSEHMSAETKPSRLVEGAIAICGQTLSEYTLVLAAVAVARIGTYLALGNNVGALANGVDSTVSNSASVSIAQLALPQRPALVVTVSGEHGSPSAAAADGAFAESPHASNSISAVTHCFSVPISPSGVGRRWGRIGCRRR